MHYLYSGDQSLTFASGGVFSNALEAVIGDEVARKLRYKIGDEISIMHGLSAHGIFSHDEKPFKITGILSPTGTNTDRLIILPLAGLEAIHEDWKDGIPPAPASEHINEENADTHRAADAGEGTAGDHYEAENYDVSSEQEHTPRALTAFLLVMETVSIVERGFLILSVVVVYCRHAGHGECYHDFCVRTPARIAILRALGADPIEVAGALLTGLLMLTGVQILTNTFFKAHLGFTVPLQGITPTEWGYIAVIFLMAALSGIIPAIKAYLISLHTGVSSADRQSILLFFGNKLRPFRLLQLMPGRSLNTTRCIFFFTILS
ncbi:hypothetical protein CHS0354_006912 [Potamilus streckersoni]|uniref:MacB-like periplasmic core domain-containing protein n=1 Tax=Potamilus streckersoni TaxID=2493646 RepID=A0AAE0TEG3_9BIVA|nr:hypothetical protein CHS0354_006912 [Potamilus streckersoni]